MGKLMYCMVVNCGSSSLRIDRYMLGATDLLDLSVHVSGIGQLETNISVQYENTRENNSLAATNHAEALQAILGVVGQQRLDEVEYIAYRVVHGGDTDTISELIDDKIIQKIEELKIFAPEHHPPLLVCMRILMHSKPNTRHLACYDTAFFKELPDNAKHLPVPRQLFDQGVKRYGFHGLSYRFILDEFEKKCGPSAARGKVIVLHLGSGASVAAINQGQPIDTSMSMTPNSGFMMSTRSGNIDPGVYRFLLDNGFDGNSAYELLSHHSGLVGVSGMSADMYTLLEAAGSNSDAELAVDMFCREVKKTLCGFAGVMGGVDSVIFTGGMGENAPRIRKRVLAGLEFMGIELDSHRNEAGEELISSDNSRVGVHVYKTNESQTMIKEVKKMIERVDG